MGAVDPEHVGEVGGADPEVCAEALRPLVADGAFRSFYVDLGDAPSHGVESRCENDNVELSLDAVGGTNALGCEFSDVGLTHVN